jgi:hypothetical protein
MRTAINVNPAKPYSIKRQARRLMTINGFAEGDYNPHNVRPYLIRNEHISCIAIGYHLQDAIDNIVNEDLWDSLQLDSGTYEEYEREGWDDSYILAGNASEPFWFEHVLVEDL